MGDADELGLVREELAELRALMTKVVDRLLDVALPTAPPPDAVTAEEKILEVLAKYDVGSAEVEVPIARDWTDPFIAITNDRAPNVVGRVEAGGELPFVDQRGVDGAVEAWREQGEGAFDEWARETYLPDVATDPIEFLRGSWVDPLEI